MIGDKSNLYDKKLQSDLLKAYLISKRDMYLILKREQLIRHQNWS